MCDLGMIGHKQHPTRDKLRAAVRIVNQTINVLKAAQHPEKTFIGRAVHLH